MYKTLAKFLIPAGLGAGIICITMHLTNSAGALLNSLLPIDLKKKPEIPEEEIHPQVQEQQATEQQSQQQDSSNEETSSSAEPSSEGTDTSAQSKPSTNTSNGDSDIKEVIQFYAKQISDKGNIGISNSQSLVNIHEALTALTRLTEGVKQLSSEGGSSTTDTKNN